MDQNRIKHPRERLAGMPQDTTVDDAIALLDSLYDSGDLSVDQHAGIMRGFDALRAKLPGCPIANGIWGDLRANLLAGDRIVRPEQKRLFMAAEMYMVRTNILWMAAAAWRDAVVSDLDEAEPRAALLKVIRDMETGGSHVQ